MRFQLKAPDALAAAWRPLGTRDHGLSKKDIAEFDHGWAGMAWANQEYRQWVRRDDPDREIWEQWQPWLAAVTGHHGDFYAPRMPGLILDTNEAIIDHDRNADGLWPHPHGARTAILVDGGLKWKFSAFRATSPAWTQLSEFVVPRGVNDPNVREGSEPSGPVAQADELGEGWLHLWVGGYCAKQGSIVGRRHDMLSLAKGWRDDKERLPKLIAIGMRARDSLLDAIFQVAFGKGELKGIGLVHKKKGRRIIRDRKDATGFHDISEKLFYARTESLIHETFSNEPAPMEWAATRSAYAQQIASHCRAIFEKLTDPYAMKPELIPVIAWAQSEQ